MPRKMYVITFPELPALPLSAGDAVGSGEAVGVALAPVDVAVGPEGELAIADRAGSALYVYRIRYDQ